MAPRQIKWAAEQRARGQLQAINPGTMCSVWGAQGERPGEGRAQKGKRCTVIHSGSSVVPRTSVTWLGSTLHQSRRRTWAATLGKAGFQAEFAPVFILIPLPLVLVLAPSGRAHRARSAWRVASTAVVYSAWRAYTGTYTTEVPRIGSQTLAERAPLASLGNATSEHACQ